MPFPSDTEPDTEIEALLARELERQTTGLQLIASENFTSPAVMRAVGSVLTNKYSEGYPGKRYYGGNAVIDDVEALAIERVKALFGAEHANVQPHSGANANMCVYQALLEPGDTVLGLSLDHGGHLTHGSPVNASGMLYRFVAYKVTPGDERIDMDQVRDLALEHRPKMIVAGTTRYPRRLDPEPFRAIADEVGALFLFDAAHIAGLIAGGAHPTRCRSPTSSRSRRTRRCAARVAAASCRKAEHATGDRQGGVPRLAGRSARARHRRQGGGVPRGGPPVVQGVRPPDRDQRVGAGRGAGGRGLPAGVRRHRQPPDGRRPAAVRRRADRQDRPDALDEAGITLNKNTIPDDPRSPFVTSGLRIGTPSVTTQGMEEAQMARSPRSSPRALRDRDDAGALGARSRPTSPPSAPRSPRTLTAASGPGRMSPSGTIAATIRRTRTGGRGLVGYGRAVDG